MLLVLETSVHKTFEWDTFRLMNFYLIFPHFLKEIRPLPTQLRNYRAALNGIPESYVEVPNAKRALFDLGVLQVMAANHMAAKRYINIDFQMTNSVSRKEYSLSPELTRCIESDPIRKNTWFKMIVDELPLLDPRGKGGLKKRSGLMEFQYDVEREQK
jgi:hypothetical protein